MSSEDYESGRRQQKVAFLENVLYEHKKETKSEFAELWKIQKAQERIIWMLIGAVGLINFLPMLRGALN